MRIPNIKTAITGMTFPEIAEFVRDSKVYEKVNTHYVKVHIVTPSHIICMKGTGESITQTDIILNGMWRNFVEDWTLINNNPGFREFAKHYTGCILGMYYFPCNNPLGTDYSTLFKTERCYAINQVYDTGVKAEMTLSLVFMDMQSHMGISGMINPGGKYKIIKFTESSVNMQLVNKLENFPGLFDTEGKLDDIDAMEHALYDTINTGNQMSVNHPNYIFHNNKKLYQIATEDIDTDSVHTTDVKERTSYEFVLCDFIKFFHERNMLNHVRGTYRNIVCYLFNEYINTWESKDKYIENNIEADKIQPPHVGYDHGDSIDHVYVPNTMTLDLCNQSLLYRNIFKLLLANLKVYKKKKYCVYMNDEQIGALNTIVKAINVIKSDQTPLKYPTKQNNYGK